MASKWRHFFHSIFTFLSWSKWHFEKYLSHWRNCKGYILLSCITAIAVLASPSFAKMPIAASEILIAQNSPTSVNEAQHLDQTARQNYANGQFKAAAIAFQQAAQRYQVQGDSLGQAISLSNLSLTQQKLGQWTEASEAISESLRLLEADLQQNNFPDRQSAYAQVLDIYAKLKLSQGQAEQAIAIWEQAATIQQQLGNVEQAKESQINQARALQALGLYKRAIAVLQSALQTPQQPALLADLDRLESAAALDILQQRLQALTRLLATPNTATALERLGEALQVDGDLAWADRVLQSSLEIATHLSSSEAIRDEAIASANLNLGNVTRTKAIAQLRLNNLSIQQAVIQLQKLPSLSPIQRELQYRRTEAAQAFKTETDKALDYYQQAATASSPTLTQTQAHLNRLNLLLDRREWTKAEAAIEQVNPLLNSLPPSRAAIDARINLAQSLVRLTDRETEPPSRTVTSQLQAAPRLQAARLQAAQLLAAAHQQSIGLHNAQADSYALGSLGELYEQSKQWSEAETVTRQALKQVNSVSVTNLPATVNDADLAYRWQYQLGRILAAQGDREEAIKAYSEAAKTLQDRLRSDVAASNLNYQFSFNQDAQQPVHRDLMDLLLRPDQPTQKDLQRVREISTSLLEAQLTSFLQEPCAVATPQEIDTIVQEKKQKTAVFYPVILPDRLEVIVKLPGNETLYRYRHSVSRNQFLEQLNKFQIALEEEYTFEAVESLAQQFYDWLVKPAESQLEANQVDTLIFTLDRQLQTIPMAALYDGKQYLIDKYAVSEILGLKFASAQSLQPEELKVMAAGLSNIPPTVPQNVQEDFLPLVNVNRELDELDALNRQGIQVVTLRDQNFTRLNFNAQLNEARFPVVHLATHGQFSVDPQRTFLLTAQDSSGKSLIDVDELAALFRVRGRIRLDSIDLLILNACETAAGDDLATLGIAGTAVRAGAQSAIASLWTLDDAPSVDFTKYLYENLRKPDFSRAEALRQTQLALKRTPQYQHPRYWSPYILAGNWLPLTTSRTVGTADFR